MKLIAPDYYNKFCCIADRCKHNCCIGWEIDIDDKTLDFYKNVKGEFGKRLESNISFEGGEAHFLLTEDEHCPFLNNKNLCDIITSFGEEGLCNICADHPRFRNFLSDRTEIGLGLCCEAAGRLILGNTEKVKLVEVENDGLIEKSFTEEFDFLKLRYHVFDILQNRNDSIDKRISKMLNYCNVVLPKKTNEEWADVYLGLERLDSSWTDMLNDLKTVQTDALSSRWNIVFEQLLVYFAYRHLAGALEDDNISARAAFVAQSYFIIYNLCAIHQKKYGVLKLENIVEIVRMYSSEIEYSDENIEILLDILKN